MAQQLVSSALFQDALRKLKVKLETFPFTQYPMAIIAIPSSELLPTALQTANDSLHLLESLLRATPVDEKQYKVTLASRIFF